ncbi:hypothetical protein HYS31_08525 [Candidatus Woesearchaeota archaeon]|nr:hypothetical protein [Candidatus Woesearchaeota archaeon]
MVNAKRGFSLLSIIFLILGNVAFAQSDPSVYEGKPIDPSREGIDYYREGDIIVYPSREMGYMEGFRRGDISEEELKKMAKARLGDKFNEMEFKRGFAEFNDRMERKDAFSYEHEGYSAYSSGPSYEGYSKERMLLGMLYEYFGDDIDPREIKQRCNEPENIADEIISRLKEKMDIQNVCKRIEDQEVKCEEYSKQSCSKIGTAFVREGASETEKLNAVAYSCPVNRDAIAEACKRRNKYQMEQRLEHLDTGNAGKGLILKGKGWLKNAKNSTIINYATRKNIWKDACLASRHHQKEKARAENTEVLNGNAMMGLMR